MNWEQTILEVRANPAYSDLVKEAYLGGDLKDNVERFYSSQEFRETKRELKQLLGDLKGLYLLDIGAGNGISTIAFAKLGINVVALEPDPSSIIGAEAIRKNARIHGLEEKVKVEEAWGESLPFEDGAFDIVYGRQVLHHAHELNSFVKEASRVVKKGGVVMTTRDHVIKDDSDKEKFLERHPLHKFYGGENAFTIEQYSNAYVKADLTIKRSLNAKSTAINYDPWSKKKLATKVGILAKLPIVSDILMFLIKNRLNNLPGRLHTFIAVK